MASILNDLVVGKAFVCMCTEEMQIREVALAQSRTAQNVLALQVMLKDA